MLRRCRWKVTDGKFKITFTSNVENPQINCPQLIPAALAAAVQTSAAPAALAQGVIRIKAVAPRRSRIPAATSGRAELGFDGGDVIERDAGTVHCEPKDAGLYRSEHYGNELFYLPPFPTANTWPNFTSPKPLKASPAAGERVFSFNVQGREFKDLMFSSRPAAPTAPTSRPSGCTNGKFTITVHQQRERIPNQRD